MPLIKRTLEDEEALMREWAAMAGDGPIKEPLNQDESEPSMEEILASIRRIMKEDTDSLLGFDEPAELSMTDLLIKMRTDKKLRKESMPFWGFLSDLAMGMSAIRDSWPSNWKRTGLWMNDEGRLILNGIEWVPTQDDLFADDWQIGD